MTDIPIIFSAPMVLALLEGRKTQTRRLAWTDYDVRGEVDLRRRRPSLWQKVKPGDRLWVRETWQTGVAGDGPTIAFRANNDYGNLDDFWDGPNEGAGPTFNYDRCPGATWGTWLPDLISGAEGVWRTPLHMPRWASRMTLVVTATKMERLQDISEEDARAEGAMFHGGGSIWHSGWRHDYKDVHADARSSFARLWKELHGPESWDANPEVVALTFEVHKQNIDAMKEAA